MTSQEIDKILSELKVDSRGRIRNKGRVTDKLRIAAWQELDETLMGIRIFMAKNQSMYAPQEFLKMLDDIIYQKQISQQ